MLNRTLNLFLLTGFLLVIFQQLLPNNYRLANLQESAALAQQPVMPVVNPPSPATNLVVSLTEFMTSGVSAYEAFKRAIDACRQRKAAMLIIPTGRYVFDDPQIAQLTSGSAHAGLYTLSDLTIDGQGSEFVFHYPSRSGFGAVNSQRILVRNLNIDYDVTLAYPGIAQKELDGRTSIRVRDDYLVDENTKFNAVSKFDLTNLRWKRSNPKVFGPTNVTLLRPQTFVSPNFNGFADGDEVILRYRDSAAAAFGVYLGSSDITLENVTVYNSPNMAFIFGDADRGFRLSRCKVLRKPGTNRLISTVADGAHFGSTKGDIIVEDCDFSSMGDDSLNIHGNWLRVISKVAERTFSLTKVANLTIEPGEELKVCKAENLAEYGRFRVIQVAFDAATQRFTITVDHDLPNDLAVGDLVGDLARNGSRFLIRRNYFHDHRARGMLIQSQNGLVENNVIKDVTWGSMNLTTDANIFFEGFGCENLIVRNNTLIGGVYSGEGMPASRHMASLSIAANVPSGLSTFPVHKNLLIEGNTIIDTAGLAILAASADGVTVRNNIINGSNMLSYGITRTGTAIDAQARGSIMVTRASNVTVTGNRQVISPAQFDKGVYVDPRNTSGVTVQDNLEVNYPAHISAASYNGQRLAPESIVAAFGPGLATEVQSAATLPLPTTLAGTTIKVKDFVGIERLAPLFFAAPNQINYQIPPGTSLGSAVITITAGNGETQVGVTQVESVAPGLFSANASGQGVAAAVALRVRRDGTQSFESITRYDATQNKFVTVPLDLGPEGEQVFLILYGTGVRFRSSLSAVTAKIGGVNAEVLFAGAIDGFVGLDQINLRIPRSLSGRGETEIALMADGKTANTVQINIK